MSRKIDDIKAEEKKLMNLTEEDYATDSENGPLGAGEFTSGQVAEILLFMYLGSQALSGFSLFVPLLEGLGDLLEVLLSIPILLFFLTRRKKFSFFDLETTETGNE